ncbi:MAG: 2-oxo acid dehydrogenase subunit E2, partial [Caulobacterales bacterium]|nr:2-oxo acid dehydrogenase subunit E2 [Caulobacterales bacterium]
PAPAAAPPAPSAAPAPAAAAPAASAKGLSVPSAVRDPRDMGIQEGPYDLVPLDGMRKTIARRMTESFRDVPHFPLTIDVELDALLAQRKRLNERVAEQGVKISVNDFLIRASALALKKAPASNASYSPDGILYHHHADVAVAVAIENGLITPIVRKADTKGMAEISAEMKELAARARDRKLLPEEYTGGTFSLSNLGMFGIKSFASILNEPHGMIMSVGAGERRPLVKDGALAVATVMSVTITCDHRVVDGSIGAEFASAFKAFCEDPETMLL